MKEKLDVEKMRKEGLRRKPRCIEQRPSGIQLSNRPENAKEMQTERREDGKTISTLTARQRDGKTRRRFLLYKPSVQNTTQSFFH